MAKPDTILAWYRRLVAQKFDGSLIVLGLFGLAWGGFTYTTRRKDEASVNTYRKAELPASGGPCLPRLPAAVGGERVY